VGTVMHNRKELPKKDFAEKLREGKKITRHANHLTAAKGRNVREVVNFEHCAQ
jgi:hypothetical protein